MVLEGLLRATYRNFLQIIKTILIILNFYSLDTLDDERSHLIYIFFTNNKKRNDTLAVVTFLGSPQERFHMRCNRFHRWETLSIPQIIQVTTKKIQNLSFYKLHSERI